MRASSRPFVLAAVAATVFATLAPAPALAATPRKVSLGVSASGVPWRMSEVDRFERDAGHHASLISFYAGWIDEFNRSGLDAIATRGSMPIVTWEPWDYRNGTTNQPSYRLSAITGGAWDAYITRWAQAARDWGKSMQLRFAHEMNGNWYPWAEGVNGNVAGDYVNAWRHVRAIFRTVGANNVSWIWSPNVEYFGSTPLNGLYPGDTDVDYVGIDGYNWGTAVSGGAWLSFNQIFGPTLSKVRSITSKWIMLSEVASSELGGNKASWITDFFNVLDVNPDIFAFVWFNWNKETDWRIESSRAATKAFANGVAPRAW